MASPLNLTSTELLNGLTVEASAGTGKTYSVAALITRELACNDDLGIENVLVTTFTRAAAAELRDRIRRRLRDTANALDQEKADSNDELLTWLSKASAADRQRYVRNLRRAVVNFDNATIGTIHSVCSRILAMAGIDSQGDDAEEFTARTISQVVNDRLVSEALVNSNVWDEGRIAQLLRFRLDNPLIELFYTTDNVDEKNQLEQLKAMIGEMVAAVHDKTRNRPSFNDLVRRAEEVLRGDSGDAVRKRFADRFSLAIIDEAQDTDGLQWRLFHHVFPKGVLSSDHRLVSVGDPKQAIYSFRGADVYAYLDARNEDLVSTLTVNYRSDQSIIDALNMLFEGKSLGKGIDYIPITADASNQISRIGNMSSVEAIDTGDLNNDQQAADAACRQVRRILEIGTIDRDGQHNRVRPQDICVLADSNTIVRLVQRQLQKHGIPAVASGSDSVFADSTAKDIRVLLLALERISDTGRVRNLAATAFFGVSLADPRLLPEDLIEQGDKSDDLVLQIQEQLSTWLQRLRRGGVSGLLAALEADDDVMSSVVSGLSGERHLADLSQVLDLLHAETRGRSTSPSELLEAFDRLSALDRNSDLVARRVESDAAAVQVMSVHKAKGLEFPCVVVASLWKPKPYKKHLHIPRFRNPDSNESRQEYVDIGWVLDKPDEKSKSNHVKAAKEEQKRLLYVALTRAKHHLSFLWPSTNKEIPIILDALNGSVIGSTTREGNVLVARLSVDDLPEMSRYKPTSVIPTKELEVEVGPVSVEQSLRRTSFTGITRAQKSLSKRVGVPEFEQPGSGNDETPDLFVARSRYASPDVPTGVPMPLARIVGGKHVGKVLHKVYEIVDTSAPDLREEIAAKCAVVISGGRLLDEIDAVVDGITQSLTTPLGPEFGNRTLAEIGSVNRLPELDFEMSVAGLTSGVKVSDFGRVLAEVLDSTDVLYPYASLLSHESFDIDLAGLVNGSIDAVLQLGSDDDPALWITDYKSNRLDQDGDHQVIDGYRQGRLFEAMVDHHYPLQALIYGAAMYRYLRWRLPNLADHSSHIKGFSYFFIRGMVGANTPLEGSKPHGVFTWNAPPHLWRLLSDRLSGDPK